MKDGKTIDTCPKDGSEFLAYDPVAGKFDVCEWVDYTKNFGIISPTQVDGEYGPTSDQFIPDRATLWWPLPTA